MNESDADIGQVKTKRYRYDGEIELESGAEFGPIEVSYETYGKLNRERTNAILICHALSGDAHVAGWHEGDDKPGWWNNMIGPEKAFDTDKYYVICSNVLGGCRGTTGPNSINPGTGEPYGLDFPVVTVPDMVKVQRKLVNHLGINQLLAIAGGSFGGMQALQWAIAYPKKVKFCIPIASSAKSSPQQIAFNEVRRRAIMSDPKWNRGNYYAKEPPKDGLRLARMIGHITYLSEGSMRNKFGRRLKDKGEYSFDLDIDFEVESYLHYKGGSFVERFDANSYLYITKAIDYFDLTNNGERSLKETFADVESKFLVVAISSDWLYPPYQSKEIARALESNEVDVTYSEMTSMYGHDAFLLEPGQLKHMIMNLLSRISAKDILRTDVPIIDKKTSVKEASRVIIESEFTHIPVSEAGRKLVGILTAWDIAKAVANGINSLPQIMTEDVITVSPNEHIDSIIRKIWDHNISALPVVDEGGKILGIVTSESITQLVETEQPIPGVKER